MAVELQGLIERIQSEGIEKANAQKEMILSQAKAEAAQIIAEAKAQAEAELKQSRQNSESLQLRAESAIKQAARDILLTLRTDLQKRLNALVKKSTAQTMTPQVCAQMLLEIAKNARDSMELVLPSSTAEGFISELVNNLKQNPQIVLRNDFSGGFKVGFNKEDVYLDFSDDALTELICAYVGPKIAAVLEAK